MYPQDYFASPLDGETILAGTFGELRSNHFHSGLDIKTKQREGLKVYAAASGYVSRIKIAHFGYGKALYITHPNGYTTVYAHLQRFSDKIESFIKKKQYDQESFEVEVFPSNNELILTKGEVIAYSGNTGSSGGPHLHYEIRDNLERPINPLLFGIKVKDTKKPIVKSIYAYPINELSHVNNSNLKQKLRLIPLQNGDYKVEDIKAYGKIGFAINTIDRQDLAANKNGVYKIETALNGMPNFTINFKRFSFDETKHLNRLIDYPHYSEKKERLQKLFLDTNNPLSMYDNLVDDGYIMVYDSIASLYKIKVEDFEGNTTIIDLNINGDTTPISETSTNFTSQYYINREENVILEKDKITVNIPKETFYDSFFMDFQVHSDTVKVHDKNRAANKYFTINYDITGYSPEDLKQVYIARLVGWNNYPSYSSTKQKDNVLYTRTKNLGTYCLARDTVAPIIEPVNFTDGKWMSKYRFLKLKIEDKQSGISNYRATVNGKWILMEYDYKTDMLVHDFKDNVVKETNNNLKVIVTDNVGNSATFEATFHRK
ncbi:M23 family metallopeptidase [Mesoflavibacter sp. CH_XMU1422-2]|uniref:M23 family metallopeptidase n=1 Tax=Mesoflavibacter sp. CH_XMU1422-2 TaxID=3107770 RepID=UPI00300BF136